MRTLGLSLAFVVGVIGFGAGCGAGPTEPENDGVAQESQALTAADCSARESSCTAQVDATYATCTRETSVSGSCFFDYTGGYQNCTAAYNACMSAVDSTPKRPCPTCGIE